LPWLSLEESEKEVRIVHIHANTYHLVKMVKIRPVNPEIIVLKLTLMLQLGWGILPSDALFIPPALKLLRIVTNAFVTFLEYMWAKNAEKNFRYLH